MVCSQIENQRSLETVECTTFREEYIWNFVLKLLIGPPIKTVNLGDRLQNQRNLGSVECTTFRVESSYLIWNCFLKLSVGSPIKTVKLR
jgi:hypothetical protein